MKKVGEQNDVILKSVVTTVSPGSTVKISSDDKKADYLSAKLIASTGITLTQNHPGSIEDMTIAAHVAVTLATDHGLGLSGQTLNMGTPSTCTAATTNAVTTTTHTHAITGFLTTVTAHNVLSATHGDSTAGSAVAGDIIYADNNPKWTKLAHGNDGEILTLASGLPSWAAAPATTHAILSATHTDSTASTVARGDIIIGSGATPKWDNLAVGASTTYLNGGTEPNWKVPIAADITIPNGVGTPTYDDVQDFLNMTQASGRFTGGVLTASATVGAVDISAMEMMVHTANTLGSPLIYFKKAAVSDLALTVDPGVNYIWATYTDAGGGTITYSANAARPTEDYHVFVIGRAFRLGSDVEVLTTGQNIYNQYGRMQDRLLTKYGSMDHATGAIISAHATPLRLQCTGSKWYFGNTLIDLSLVTPNTFYVWYRHAGGAWTETAAKTLFSEAIITSPHTHNIYETYQDGTDLTALGGSKYGVYWIFMCPEGDLYVILGTASYANIGLAQASTVPANLPNYCINWARLIGRAICQDGGAAFYSVESVFSTQFTLSATVDHASLSGLTAADSHPQAAITGLTTADGPTFNHLHLTTDLAVAEGGTGASTFALNGVLFGNAANAIGVTAIGAEGQILRVGANPFVPAWSTLTLPNTGTAYRLPVFSATNVMTELAAVGATGEYLKGNTGAIPSWVTLNQAAVAGLTTADGPTFDHIHASVTLCPVVEIATAEPAGRDNGHLWYDSDATATGYSIDVLMVEIFSGG